MSTIEDLLAEETHKHDGLDVEHRVFYTLIGEPGNPNRAKLQAHRNSKALAMLCQFFNEKRLISDAQLDELLLYVVS
jgi:hypothetical protein